MTTHFLVHDLMMDEGLRTFVYRDSTGNLTWGYGHKDNSVDPRLTFTAAQCRAQLMIDVDQAEQELDVHCPWWDTLANIRQDVLVNMMFNLGWGKLGGFKRFLAAAQAHDYARAAEEMLDSLWAKQVHGRAIRLAEQMRTGEHQ